MGETREGNRIHVNQRDLFGKREGVTRRGQIGQEWAMREDKYDTYV